jgi:cytochrome c oxidase subunit III
MMTSVQRNKIHPHKFILWVAIGSIIMMFAGLTSAYIVKKGQANWTSFHLPVVFWYSTAAIILSSGVLYLSVKAFKEREMMRYRTLMTVTALLGVVFVVLQVVGFNKLQASGIKLVGTGSSIAGSFLLVIAGLHILHVLGGVVALVVMFLKAFSRTTRSYSMVPVEVVSTYWHFVDLLWIYLFVFLSFAG